MKKRKVMHAIRVTGCAFLIASFLPLIGVAQTRDPLPVPDIPGFKTLKCDFHLHTVFSDAEVWPVTRVTEAWRDGLDAISITDHSDYNPHKDDVKLDLARVQELARPAAEGLGILLIPGIEVAENDIHCNALFITDPSALRGAKLIAALQKARAQDAFVFWNHPGWKQAAEWFPLIADAYGQKLIQGVELVNGDSFYPEAYPWVEEKKLTIMADSDAHEPIAPAQPGEVRPITLVFARAADSAGVREALCARRTAAWMGGEVWGEESVLKMLWEGAVKVAITDKKLTSDTRTVILRLQNDSAIPFRLSIRKAPEWLRLPGEALVLKRQSVSMRVLSVAKNAPSGPKQAEIELEITNFHIAPGVNLMVSIPIAIN